MQVCVFCTKIKPVWASMFTCVMALRFLLRILLLHLTLGPDGVTSAVSKCDFLRLDLGAGAAAEGLSEAEFRSRCRGESGRPCVLSGLRFNMISRRGGGTVNLDLEPESLAQRFGDTEVASQHAVVYHAVAAAGKPPAKTRLGEPTTLASILGGRDATLFLLEPFQAAVAAATEGLAVPALLRPIQMTGPTVSLGGLNASSPFHQHQENWFAQVRGKKMWVVGPADNPGLGAALKGMLPCDPPKKRGSLKAMKRCVVQEGEVVYLPPQWHHGTCNVGGFSLGVGFIGALDHLPKLHLAAALGDDAAVPELVHSRRDLEARDNELKQPLHWAARRGHDRTVVQLLRLRANPSAEDANGAQPAHFAAFEGHLPCTKAILGGEHVKAVDVAARAHAGAQPLHLAASRGHLDVARYLLKRGAYAGARDTKGAEPLHMAAYEGHRALVELLVSRGASARAAADDGTEPAQMARSRRHDALSEWLARPMGAKRKRRGSHADL